MAIEIIKVYIGKQILRPGIRREEEITGVKLDPSFRYSTPLSSDYKSLAGREAKIYTFEPFEVVEMIRKEYPTLEDDLEMGHLMRGSTKLSPKKVRAVIAKLQSILPAIPETPDPARFSWIDSPRQLVKELIDFLEKAAAFAEASKEYLWFLAM
nr:hypothetical protein [Candidatus Sigynarchaeum springense]